jgi:starch phosphorylase
MESMRPLPPALERLGPLAFDLRLAGSKTMAQVWRRLDPEAWDRTNNPHIVLLHAHQDRLDEAAADPALLAQLDDWFERRSAIDASAGWYGSLDGSDALTGIAYFSMEFGLAESLPIYSGGLGILAGDHLKSANDLGVPVIGVGLLYQQGYFRQVLAPDGSQLEAFPFNDPGSLPVQPVLDADGRWPRIRLELPGRTLLLRVWQVRVGKVCLYLLDSNHPLNSPWDRGITADLYAAGREKRLLQELVLGVGGYRLLEKLGIEVQVCHLNEGHAAFAVVARAASYAHRTNQPFATALRATRAGNVFTTHTPVEAAFDRFDPDLVRNYAGPLIGEAGIDGDAFLALGRRDPNDHAEPFNMAYLAVRGSGNVNGVAKLHGQASRRLFASLFAGWPVGEVPVGHVTNGIHVPTWHSELAAGLWSEAYGTRRAWLGDLDGAAQAVAGLPDERLWQHRAASRAALVDYVRERLVRQAREHADPAEAAKAAHILDPNRLTIGFARRFAGYKRPWLMLADQDRFARLLSDPDRPVQILVAGKAHPDDAGSKGMVRDFSRFSWRDDVHDRVVFLADYDMVLAQHLVAGVDVWLNNPRRPLEASGTSGMKVLVNGGLHCSTLDGWWDEAYEPAVGWAIGDREEHDASEDGEDAEALYQVLEQQVVPEFYDRDELGLPRAWIRRVRASMSSLTPRFSSDRMVREYVQGIYLPAATAVAARTADGGRAGAELEAWSMAVAGGWASIRFGRISVTPAPAGRELRLEVFLGDVPADGVRVEAYADPPGGDGPGVTVPMAADHAIVGAVNGTVFAGVLPEGRPVTDYTPRVVPSHAGAIVPLDLGLIAWGPRPPAISDPSATLSSNVASAPVEAQGTEAVPA